VIAGTGHFPFWFSAELRGYFVLESETEQTIIKFQFHKYGMGQAERPTCPNCGAHLILALPPGGEGRRRFQCFECDGPDPLKTEWATGWLKGELQPPK
jgi:hypothetical protein